MAYLTTYYYSNSNTEGLDMNSFAMSGVIILDTPTWVETEDNNWTAGYLQHTSYDGKFKSENGDINGIINSYDSVYMKIYSQANLGFTIFNLKLDFKTVQSLAMSNDSLGFMKLALKGNDTIYGSNFMDYLYGFNGNDTIYGGDDLDFIKGGLGNDKIYGENGNDFIYGGLGKDILTGGLDLDMFYFDTKLGKSNVDTITDFVVGNWNTGGIVVGDQLNLDKSIFTRLTEGMLNNQELVFGTKALDNNDYLIFNPKTHTLSYDADANGAGKAIAFVVLTGVNTTPDDLSADIYVY